MQLLFETFRYIVLIQVMDFTPAFSINIQNTPLRSIKKHGIHSFMGKFAPTRKSTTRIFHVMHIREMSSVAVCYPVLTVPPTPFQRRSTLRPR